MKQNKKLVCIAAVAALVGLMAISPAGAQPPTMKIIDNEVGIGTQDPRAKLHVLLAGTPFDLHPSTAMAFQNNANPDDGVVFSMIGGNGTNSNGQIAFGNSANQFLGRLVYSFGANAMRFFANSAERMRITGAGNVGIGTTTPAGTLDVNGPIYQRSGLLHADFVFEPDYELPTIDEQARYMWANKHLPAVGPGRYDEEGRAVIEVGASSVAMLEELEKAHIYIEQLHRRLEQLEATVASLSVEE